MTRGAPQDDPFFDEVALRRDELASHLAGQANLSELDAELVAQRAVDAIVFARFCEDRAVVPRDGLRGVAGSRKTAAALDVYMRGLDDRFHHWLLGVAPPFAPSAPADDSVLADLVRRFCALDFSRFGLPTLGKLHESALGRRHQRGRKSGGVYYTPDRVVRYIVETTLGRLLTGLAPADVAGLRILDPACGSGSFLLGALDHLIDWHRAWYARQDPASGALYRDRHGQWQLTSTKCVEILQNNIFGVDLDQRALEVTKLSLALRACEGELDQAANGAVRRLAGLDDNIRRGNSLIDDDFDYPANFPDVFARGGFDIVLGNPPYVSYGGRQAVDLPDRLRKYFARHYLSGGWATAHSLFIERSAKKLSRRLISFIVPDQVGHLAGYRSLRELVVGEGRLTEVKYWGERVFKGVVTPSLTFVLDRSERGGDTRVVNADETEQLVRIDGGAPWTASRAKTLLDKLRERSTSIRPYLADCGVRTTDAKIQVVAISAASGEFMPVLEGRQIGRYSCAPPETAVRLDAGPKLFVSKSVKYEKAEFLIRQTAAYPIVGPHEHAIYFRNSLHALYPPDNGWDVRYVVGLLNSKLLRFAYVADVREAEQRTFPQVKLGPLGALPIRQLRLDIEEEKEQHDRLVDMVAAMLDTKRALMGASDETRRADLRARIEDLDARLDAEVFQLYDLTDDEIANVESVVATLAAAP